MNKLTILTLAAVSMIGISTVEAIDSPFGSSDSSSNSYREGNGDGGTYDSNLQKRINDDLSSGWFSDGYDKVNAQVNNGRVTLNGTVQTWDNKRDLERQVRNTEGVISLTSNIEVQEPATTKNQKTDFSQDTYKSEADRQLNAKIRDELSRGYFWNSYDSVTLDTEKGVVTLKGTISSNEDAQTLMNEIQKIRGVKQVRNNLVVRQ